MDIELWKLIITALIAIAGWLVAGWLSSLRDTANKRRELVVQHLVDAYKVLTQEIGQRETTSDSMRTFEDLLSEIQLFGSKSQVEIARRLSHETATNGTSEIDPLIEDMRDSLRKELGLQPVEGNTIWLRFTDASSRAIDERSTEQTEEREPE